MKIENAESSIAHQKSSEAGSVTTLEWALLIITLAALLWSGCAPFDRFTWYLEVFPGVIGIGSLCAIRSRFRFTPLVEFLIVLHCAILFVGGHYTYEKVPLFDWIRPIFGFTRNNYDRLGHLFQGFVPAMITREILIRNSPLQRGKLMFFLVVCVSMFISSLYEIFEALVSAITDSYTGEGATAFLGTQGDPWDTQWDMSCALIGALLAQITLPRFHDRAIEKMHITSEDPGSSLSAALR